MPFASTTTAGISIESHEINRVKQNALPEERRQTFEDGGFQLVRPSMTFDMAV